MKKTVTDEDIRAFLRENRPIFPSEVTLIQAAVRLLWSEEEREAGAARVVRMCLHDDHRESVMSANQPLIGSTPERPTGEIGSGAL